MSDNPVAGWYVDPTDSTRARYWNGNRWTSQTRGLDTDTVPTPTRPPASNTKQAALNEKKRPSKWKRAVVGVAVLAAAAVGTVAVVLTGGSDDGKPSTASTEGKPRKLVYSFVSPQVSCCSVERTEGTSKFTVEGRWRVAWSLTGQGEACNVLGRISDPKKHALVDLEPFGSGVVGEKPYKSSGTYAISLTYDCPPKSIAMIQLTVFD